MAMVVAQRYRHLLHQPDPRAPGAEQGCVELGGFALPVGPPPQVVLAAQKAADEPHITGDDNRGDLREQLARHLRVDRDRLVLGAGVDPLLRDLLAVVSDPDARGGPCGSEIVYAAPAVASYSRVVDAVHAAPVAVPLAQGRQDLTALAAAIDRDRCRAVLVSNPHYPTGSLIFGEELEDFLDRVPAHVLVVLDERNRDYALYPPAITDIPDGLHLDAGHPEREGSRPNVAVLRGWDTYGLGGLPIGYLAADPQVAAMVAKTTVAPAPGRVAQVAALATLDTAVQDQYRKIWTALARERARMRDELRLLGFHPADSAANFLWIPLAEAVHDFADHCTRHTTRHGVQHGSGLGARPGVHLSVYPGHGVLVPVGLPEHNALFLAAAASYRLPADRGSAGRSARLVAPVAGPRAGARA